MSYTEAVEARSILDGLADTEGIHGACLVRRDGLPVLQAWPHPSDVDTLAAMGAALMGAAEASLLEFGDRALQSVLVASEGLRLSVLGVDADHLLLTAMSREAPLEGLDAALAQARDRLQEVLAGA